MIGFEDRLYADLYKRAIAAEYVNEAWGSPKAEGRDKNVEMAALYCRKKDTTSELYRSNGNVEGKSYDRGMKFAICMEHALEDVPWAKKCLPKQPEVGR